MQEQCDDPTAVLTRKLTTDMIKINRLKDDLLASLNDRQAEIPADAVEGKWKAFKSIGYKVAKEEIWHCSKEA